MTTGQKIKSLREKAGLTQEELGQIVGVQKSAINKYECGRVVNLKQSMIFKLANALNCQPSYLVGDTLSDSELTVEESDLVRAYRELDTFGKDYIRRTLEMLRK